MIKLLTEVIRTMTMFTISQILSVQRFERGLQRLSEAKLRTIEMFGQRISALVYDYPILATRAFAARVSA